MHCERRVEVLETAQRSSAAGGHNSHEGLLLFGCHAVHHLQNEMLAYARFFVLTFIWTAFEHPEYHIGLCNSLHHLHKELIICAVSLCLQHFQVQAYKQRLWLQEFRAELLLLVFHVYCTPYPTSKQLSYNLWQYEQYCMSAKAPKMTSSCRLADLPEMLDSEIMLAIAITRFSMSCHSCYSEYTQCLQAAELPPRQYEKSKWKMLQIQQALVRIAHLPEMPDSEVVLGAAVIILSIKYQVCYICCTKCPTSKQLSCVTNMDKVSE